ncbi:FadR/GntR family transcriptional regulator [Phycicoccus avicenniae]|uniref:FadR/GntR family transcriptional regulator n=1 Tax=Phycicoccus avicenniae TaxID=2828860 RepID=UPI003D28787F
MSDQRTVFHPVKTRRAAEDVIAQIAEMIHAGDLVPGDRLPPERAIAAQTQLSRPTIRQALQRLSEAGLLLAGDSPAKGTQVVSDVIPPDLFGVGRPAAFDEMASTLEARRVIEPRVAQLAALYMTDRDVDDLAASIDRQADLAEDRVRFNDADARFHFLLGRATHNSSILAHTRLLQRELRILRDISMTESYDPEQSLDVHRRTLAAIVEGDHDTIEIVMDEHLSLLEDTFTAAGGRLRARRPPTFLGRGVGG